MKVKLFDGAIVRDLGEAVKFMGNISELSTGHAACLVSQSAKESAR